MITSVRMLSSVGKVPSVYFIALESGHGVPIQQTNDYKVDSHYLSDYGEYSGYCALLVHYVVSKSYGATRPAHL